MKIFKNELEKKLQRLVDVLSCKGLLTYDEYHFIMGERYKEKVEDLVTELDVSKLEKG